MVSFAHDSQELAEKYDIVGQRQLEHGKELVRDLNIKPGERVLDVGTGTGLLANYVAELVAPQGRVVGVDPLPLRIELARRKAHPAFEAHVGQAENLSAFPASSFDVVYLNSVFHWLPSKATALRQIRRVLRAGGRIGLSSAAREQPHSLDLVRKRALEASGLEGKVEASTGILKVTSDELRALLVATGFRVRQLEIRSFTDHFRDVNEVLDFGRASSFGNDQSLLGEAERARFQAALARELEPYRKERGIEQTRHLIFAVAEKLSD
jgi:arsenite methyltransferase